MTVQAVPRPVACPRCGGCLPGEGPACDVCTCGSRWADELLSDPPPPDSRPEEIPVTPPAPVLSDTTEEETPDHG